MINIESCNTTWYNIQKVETLSKVLAVCANSVGRVKAKVKAVVSGISTFIMKAVIRFTCFMFIRKEDKTTSHQVKLLC